ncbi:MAG: hypothetical protein IPG46_04990 [Actinobacteria bacterium]|nr:hypothetical protein [Actinomycetota bacterium]
MTNATAIVVGGYPSCAVLADGTVRCWGYNRERPSAMAPPTTRQHR